MRYGGNTSCVALGNDSGPPKLVLDAGTGLPRLTSALDGEPFKGTILLGHLHWDHTHGLPFFRPGDHPGAQVELVMPQQGDPERLLERVISPPHFPIKPGDLRGRWAFSGIEAGEHEIEGFSVLALDIPHKGGRMFGYRITDGSATIAYVSDHNPTTIGPGSDGLGELHDAACALADGVDVLIHDAQYTAEEFPARASFGHSAVDYAINLAEACDVGRLLLFHHDPSRTDAELDAITADAADRKVTVEAATEDSVIHLSST